MKTRVVPASELDPKKGLRASDYVGPTANQESEENKVKRVAALGNFIAARAEYLRATGWAPFAPAALGAPVWWKSPHRSDQGRKFREDAAADHQELLDNDLEAP